MQPGAGKRVLFLTLLVAATKAAVFKGGRKSNIILDQIEATYSQLHQYGIIFPGTKWCGDGDIAQDFDDLGYFKNTDKCCRAHDYCEDIIPSGEMKHGLLNKGSYTRLRCDCDYALFHCLSGTKCKISGVVAISYFNVLGVQCFDLKPPAKCVKYDDILGYLHIDHATNDRY